MMDPVKAITFLWFAIAIFGIVAVVSVQCSNAITAKNMANAGLQQCIVKINTREEIIWKKECDK